ncbi:hypothetical protein BB561_003414 [Smittium simulii]|uniref:Trafficking protein particle complex subunit BET3 n=1 Tax=Smittium simulii TaxID=133385 RepID=A0A2T9YLJ1_9FUNG|nr:hypothetical protein BB561_003414 [Smittium simulii]
MVLQLVKDYEDYDLVNKQLETMGYNTGMRLIDDFLARTQLKSASCKEFRTVMEIVAKVGFKMYLNIVPTETFTDDKHCTLTLVENPLAENVELPQQAIREGLWYSSWYCGVLKGALEMVQLEVNVSFLSDVLRGDETTELQVELVRILDEQVPVNDD